MNRKIIIGSRGSKLALWQAEDTQTKLRDKGFQVEIKIIKTQGDKIQHLSFDKMEGKGFFTKELEEELLNKSIDLAVHSHKDLPTAAPPGLIIAGVSARENPSECLLVRKESYAPGSIIPVKQNAIVGTSAPRRKSQLLFFRPDLTIKDLRGNVPTRISKLERGDYDAIMVAKAGMQRLNLSPENLHVKTFSTKDFIPAPAQGVLAYQVREDDHEMIEIISSLEDSHSAEIMEIERGLLKSIEGGCQVPAGVFCEKANGQFDLWATLAHHNSAVPKRLRYTFRDKTDFNPELTAQMLKETTTKKVFISTEADKEEPFYKTLNAHGYQIEAKSLVHFEALEFEHPGSDFDWLFFTSKNGVKYYFEQNPSLPDKSLKIAAVGSKTAQTLTQYGHHASFVIEHTTDIEEGIQSFIEECQPKKVLIPGAKHSSGSVHEALNKLTKAISMPVYLNTPTEQFSIENADILIFTSALNAKTYFNQYALTPDQKVLAIGRYTANYLSEINIPVHGIAHQHALLHLADLVFGLELQEKMAGV